MKSKKKILVFAGPSGVGKSTLCNILLERFPKKFSFATSATTRPVREGEVDGSDYYFLSEESFKQKIQDDEFVEWEEVYEGRFYGTLNSEIQRIDNLGMKTLLDIDVLGALSIKKKFGDDVHIVFVRTESVESLEKRLRARASDSEEDILTRINRFEKELSYESHFDSIIINKTGDMGGTKSQLESILEESFEDILE